MELLREKQEGIVKFGLSTIKNSVAFFPGRFAPAHKGHIQTIERLAKEFDKVIIGIGSCYESGTKRHPLYAHFREKAILLDIKSLGFDENKFDFVHLQDFPSDDEAWIAHVMKIAQKKGVTHFVTGNKEDILDMLKEKKIKLPFEFINPENTSSFNYHAKDLRDAIVRGDYETFLKIASFGTIMLMGSIGGFESIRRAIENDGIKFVPGRQAVDIVFTINHKTTGRNGRKIEKMYFLGGRRLMSKKNFPGYLAIPGGAIEDYESPIKAAIRELKEETGIEVNLVNNTVEPAHIVIKADGKEIIGEMKFLKLFSSTDERLAGTDGGSSQVFHIHLNEDPNIFMNILKSESDLEEVGFYPVCDAKEEGLAYQQGEMVQLALSQFNLL